MFPMSYVSFQETINQKILKLTEGRNHLIYGISTVMSLACAHKAEHVSITVNRGGEKKYSSDRDKNEKLGKVATHSD